MNNQEKQKLIDTDYSMVFAREKVGWEREKRVMGIRYVVTHTITMLGDLTLGCEHNAIYR